MALKRILSLLIIAITLTGCHSINHDGYQEVSFSYAQGKAYDYEDVMYYSDDYFSLDNSIYHPSLSTASLALAMSGFASNSTRDYTKKSQNAKSLLSKLGFNDYYTNEDFLKMPDIDTFGFCSARKVLGEYTLIAVSTRGANYTKEWASNVTLGDGKDNPYHYGFYHGSDIYINSLKDYIVQQNITGKIKLWTVGYSRAGAVNNISCGRLINNPHLLGDKVILSKDNIYCYCFEAPQGVYYDTHDNIEARSDKYNCIFNIINPNDLVPNVAPSIYQFTRYGVDIFTTSIITDPFYDDNIEEVKYFYDRLANSDVLGDYAIDDFVIKDASFNKSNNYLNYYNYPVALFFNRTVNLLAEAVGSREDYVDKLQNSLADILAILFADGSPIDSAYDFGVAFARSFLVLDINGVIFNDLFYAKDRLGQDLLPLVKLTIEQLGINVDVKEITDGLVNVVDAIANMISLDISVLLSVIDKNNIKSLVSGHYPELCLAHLKAMDPLYSNNPIQYYNKYHRFIVENVDENTSFYIENSRGDEFAIIENGSVVEGGIGCYYKQNNNVYIYLPSGEYVIYTSGPLNKTSVETYSSKKQQFIETIDDDLSINVVG